MLIEAYKYLTTPCPPHHKRMGYLAELIATEARFRRCRRHWQPHLENTRAVITQAIETCDAHGKAVVLGAGILSDIPIQTLSERFDSVELVDVAFLKSTQSALRPYANVQCRSADISGVATALHDASALPVTGTPTDIALNDADLVISANLLAQLPLIPIHYARKRIGDIADAKIEAFAQGVIECHLAWLKTCPGTVALITEVERLYVADRDIEETEDPLFGVPVNLEGEEWLWDVAPRPEASKDFDIRNRVKSAYWRGKGN